MKIPAKNTCAYAICKIIYTRGERTPNELANELSDRFQRGTTHEKLREMEFNTMLTRTGDKYSIAQPVRRHFEQCELYECLTATVPGTVAPSRTAKPFTPLVGYKLPTEGPREGSDHRKFKSKHS